MQGLASTLAQPQQAGPEPMGQMPTVDEIVALLMNGTPPEEIEAMGVPQGLILEAITMLEQMMAQEQQQATAPQMGDGLAQHMVSQ